jgi:hypothetical protein
MMMRRLILSLLLLAGLASAGDLTDFTVESYWQLNKARLELAALEWQARITAVEQANGDRKAFLTRSNAITKDFAGYHRTLHRNYGLTPKEYVQFASDHAREIDSYLEGEDRVALKNDIERQRDKAQSFMQQYDALAAPLLKEDK